MTEHPEPPGLAIAQAALDGIGAQARRSNLARVGQLTAALTLLGLGELSLLERQRCVQVSHQLVGSAGTFGYARVSELARQLELFFSSALDDPGQVGSARRALLDMERDLTATAGVADLS